MYGGGFCANNSLNWTFNCKWLLTCECDVYAYVKYIDFLKEDFTGLLQVCLGRQNLYEYNTMANP